MSNEPVLREYFESNASDHQMLAAYGRLVKQIFIAESPQYVEKQIVDLKLFLNQKLVDHFAFEERHLFPALLAANPGESTARLVAALQEDHQPLLVEASRLNEMLSDQKLVSGRAKELQQALVDFLTNLHKHSSQEDELSRTLPVAAT